VLCRQIIAVAPVAAVAVAAAAVAPAAVAPAAVASVADFLLQLLHQRTQALAYVSSPALLWS
jgi:hypothetical protein